MNINECFVVKSYYITYILMTKISITIILFFSFASVAHLQNCNSTHLEFFSEYYLGRQDQLNKTFHNISEKVTVLNNVSWKANDSTTYRIGNIKPHFFYIDTKQRADIVGNSTVVIEGGKLDVRMEFDWARDGASSSSGTGVANAISDEIAFAMRYEVKDGYLLEILTAYQDIHFSNFGINITRITPSNTSEEDLKNLHRLLNDIINVTTVRHELENDINKLYNYYLSLNLYDNRRIIDELYEYVWDGPKGKFTIPFSINATGFDIQQDGVSLTYVAKIKNYTAWKCQYEAPPSLPLNPQVYGGIQEFVTFDVYKNSLKYAIDNGQLDTDLNRKNWESRFFQFYAGDLYEIIPRVAQKFLAGQVVTGSCKTSTRYVDLKKGGFDFLNVSFVYNCQIGINRDKVADFQINITLKVQGVPNATHLDFRIVSHDHVATLVPYMDYKIANVQLAQHMITHSLNRLLGHKTFGSGWKLYERDYPNFMVEDYYTVVYDSTHVDPHAQIQ